MSLLSDNTLWIFLLAASKEPEIRHIYDIANGIACIERKNISPNNIKILIDGTNKTIIEHLNLFSKSKYTINKSKDLKTIVEETEKENIVLLVSGHGNIEKGIDSPNQIKPYDLLESIRCNNKTKNIIVYLGQCYAGIFNYVNVTEKPNTIIIGATNLYPSISFYKQEIGWQANLFLYNLFRWINNPIDIDGDGKYTVMDSFKFVGAETNNYCYQYKGQCFEEALKLIKTKEEISKAMLYITNETDRNNLILALKTIQKELLQKQFIHYNIQEPWILNAIPAQKIEF